MTMRILVLAAMTIGLAGCGGSGNGSPTQPAPSVAIPTISTSNTMIYIGQALTFAATGGGTIRWGGDNPDIANVDQTSGRVTGVGTGRVTIWAENSAGRTTRLLRGLPSYAGNWQGTYAITGCQSTGDMARIAFCGNFFQGQVLSIQLQTSQTDDRVSGAFALGGNTGTLNASTVAESGLLPLTGTHTSSTGTIRIENARFDSRTAGIISGSFDQTWTIVGASGFGILSCEVRSLTRTSGGPTFSLVPPSTRDAVTVDEMIRRLLQKQ
jgi:hypothetical protein